jgi:hypothetical protein
MKVYKYWVVEKARLLIDGRENEITCYGGSNISELDASAMAREKIEKVERKIAGDDHVFESYQVEIREEIVRMVDEKTAITRNRYGAQVLNVEDLMIMDIDRPRFSFWDLFRKRRDGKAKIIEMVRTLSQKPAYLGCGFRIYETHSGIRVIVLGRTFDPKAAETRGMMKEFNCDRLYTILCRKQDCFRARLTPKPSRMRLKAHKVKFPRSGEEESDFQRWLAGYEAASRRFRTCRFVEQVGSGLMTDTVRLHDDITGISCDHKLA